MRKPRRKTLGIDPETYRKLDRVRRKEASRLGLRRLSWDQFFAVLVRSLEKNHAD